MNTLLPDRYPNKDFFVADIFDASPKDDMASMEHPMFSLATQPDLVRRHYEHNGNSITITPSILGLATIWDKERITAHDLLVSTNRPKGGSDYARLIAAFERLQGTNIKTNIVTNGETVTEGFGFIDRWKVIERSEHDDRMIAVEVKLSDWLYNAVLGSELLTINRDYFRLRGGLERRLYELARKHCGNQVKWSINLPLLHMNPLLPDYKIRYLSDKDQVIFFNRKGKKAAKAEFDAAIKTMFQPTETKKRKHRHSSKAQIELEL